MKLIEIYKGDGGHFDKTYHFPKLKKSFAELKRYLQCPQQPPFFWANMLSLGGCVPTPNMDPSNSRMLLLMEEILHHLRCIKPCKERDIYHINWCRISSINSILRNLLVDWATNNLTRLMIGQRWAGRFISTSVAEQQQPWCDSCSLATIVTYRSVWGLSWIWCCGRAAIWSYRQVRSSPFGGRFWRGKRSGESSSLFFKVRWFNYD